MTADKLNRYWTLVSVLLVVIIFVGGIVAWLRYSPNRPVEISMPPRQELVGKIYIGGAVTVPGSYSFTAEDSLEALIQAAGGNTTSADFSRLKLYLPKMGEEEPQKIDINRAEVWLLKALPDIGDTLAQRIVDYRQKNGPFSNTGELLKVAGIGTSTYEQIKELITVAD